MPVLIGFLFGHMFTKIVFSRAVLTLCLWAAVWGAGEQAGERFIGPGAGWTSGALASAAVLAWSLWRPTRSRAKIWMAEGAFVWARLGLIAAGVMTFLALLDARGDMLQFARNGWRFALGAVAIWAAQHWLSGLLARSHVREGHASVLPD